MITGMFQGGLRILSLVVIVLLCGSSGRAEDAASPSPSLKPFYDGDPNHLWNRLHRALFLRTTAEGTEYGLDQVDPLLWPQTKHLLEGTSHENAIKILDEFVSTNGEKLIRDPLKRALLQHDLWAVFDWTTRFRRGDSAENKARLALRLRLATVIRRVALTKEQINSLADNYAVAVDSHQFQKTYDESTPTTPFLPADLFSTNSSWICVGDAYKPIAPMHVGSFSGRSAFLVFMQTPGDRKEASDYLKQLREFPQPYHYKTNEYSYRSDHDLPMKEVVPVLSTNLPQFPDGTTFALVRQMMLISDEGEVVPTHLTETVQLRRYNEANPKLGGGRTSTNSQRFFEFALSHAQLLHGNAGGLRASGGEKVFRQFQDQGFDPFEEAERERSNISTWMHSALNCRECHGGGRGVYSVNSLLQETDSRLTLPYRMVIEPKAERDIVRSWKQTQFNWGVFRGLWEAKGIEP